MISSEAAFVSRTPIPEGVQLALCDRSPQLAVALSSTPCLTDATFAALWALPLEARRAIGLARRAASPHHVDVVIGSGECRRTVLGELFDTWAPSRSQLLALSRNKLDATTRSWLWDTYDVTDDAAASRLLRGLPSSRATWLESRGLSQQQLAVELLDTTFNNDRPPKHPETLRVETLIGLLWGRDMTAEILVGDHLVKLSAAMLCALAACGLPDHAAAAVIDEVEARLTRQSPRKTPASDGELLAVLATIADRPDASRDVRARAWEVAGEATARLTSWGVLPPGFEPLSASAEQDALFVAQLDLGVSWARPMFLCDATRVARLSNSAKERLACALGFGARASLVQPRGFAPQTSARLRATPSARVESAVAAVLDVELPEPVVAAKQGLSAAAYPRRSVTPFADPTVSLAKVFSKPTAKPFSVVDKDATARVAGGVFAAVGDDVESWMSLLTFISDRGAWSEQELVDTVSALAAA